MDCAGSVEERVDDRQAGRQAGRKSRCFVVPLALLFPQSKDEGTHVSEIHSSEAAIVCYSLMQCTAL